MNEIFAVLSALCACFPGFMLKLLNAGSLKIMFRSSKLDGERIELKMPEQELRGILNMMSTGSRWSIVITIEREWHK